MTEEHTQAGWATTSPPGIDPRDSGTSPLPWMHGMDARVSPGEDSRGAPGCHSHPLASAGLRGILVLGLVGLTCLTPSGSADATEGSAQAGPDAIQANLARGPYMNLGTATAVTIRWRTDSSTDSVVQYGTDPNNLDQVMGVVGATTEHVVPVTGLVPDTGYYYAVGDSAGPLDGGDGYVLTAPQVGVDKRTRIWVLGDSGTANVNAANVRDAYYGFTGVRHTDLWLMLGDNAYPDGTDADYQRAMFDMFPQMLRKSVVWPTVGNHDARSADSPTESGVYYDVFTLPRNGEAGGLASGTEAYYSFDYGNIHFICLDSSDTDRSPSGAMMTWLEEDANSTVQDWMIAFWHHPPYSKGSHDSDTEGALIDMRENALPILEAAGVDLVMSGHSHAYERSYFLDGHYGSSDTLTPSMILDPGSGRDDGDGAYRKSLSGPQPHAGTVYVVAGSSGQISDGQLDHPAMYVSYRLMGSVVLDVQGDQLDLTFLTDAGEVQDHLTVKKGVGVIPKAPSELVALAASEVQVDLTWMDNSSQETSFEIQRSGDGESWVSVGMVGSDETAYSDANLDSGTLYYYRVRALAAGEDSPFSWEAEATTDGSAGCDARLMETLSGASGRTPAAGLWLTFGAAGFLVALRRRRRRC